MTEETATATPTANAVVALSRSEYEARKKRFEAGSVSALAEDTVSSRWKAAWPEWDGKYWTTFTETTGASYLAPLNVRRGDRAH